MSPSTSKEDGLVTNWRNVRRISVFTFFDSLQFSFYMWSFWPYIQLLDPSLGATFVGILIAISGVGEAVSAPIFGYWANRIGRTNPACYTSVAASAVGNFMYFIAGIIPVRIIPYAVVVSRFLSGVGSGNRGCFRALVASNSKGADRAKALASSGGAALVGLTIGPAVQIVFNVLGAKGVSVLGMALTQYNGPALLALLINVLSFFYLYKKLDDNLSCMYMKTSSSTQKIDAPDDEEEGPSVEEVHTKNTVFRMDVIAVVICMATRAIRMLVTANMESIGAPYTEIMFNMTHEGALQYNSYAQTGNGIITVVAFIIYAFTNYTTLVCERTNCIVALVGLFSFYVLSMSWPFLGLPVDCSKYVGNGSEVSLDWDWCTSLTSVNPYIYYITYVFVYALALAVLNNSLQALYSRVLGSGPQGTMQGVNQAAGSFSRIIGPLLMSWSFSSWGPRATWGTIIVLLLLTLITWAVAYRRLVPVELRQRHKQTIAPSEAQEQHKV